MLTPHQHPTILALLKRKRVELLEAEWEEEAAAWDAAEDDDDSLVQVASKVAKKGEGSQGVWGFLEDDKEPSGDGDGDGAGEEKQKQPEGDGDADEDEQGYADLARAVPTKFLLQELAQRCTR